MYYTIELPVLMFEKPTGKCFIDEEDVSPLEYSNIKRMILRIQKVLLTYIIFPQEYGLEE